MKRRIFLAVAAIVCFGAQAETVSTRELARAAVIDCRADQQIPVYIDLESGQEAAPIVVGAPPAECRIFDSYVDAQADGVLDVISGPDGAIESLSYFADIEAPGVEYHLADSAVALWYEPNGASYMVESTQVGTDEVLHFSPAPPEGIYPIRYEVKFLRRTADLCQESTGVVAACPDQTTQLIRQDGSLVFILDYRP